MSNEENELCPFYEVHHTTTRDKPSLNPSPPIHSAIPYCTHKHSPLDEELARNAIIPRDRSLKCEGKQEKCPLMQGDPVLFYDQD